MKLPPARRAASQFSTAVRMFPTCSRPVGEGAKRVVMRGGSMGEIRIGGIARPVDARSGALALVARLRRGL
jgi:hypothetical protein